MKVLFLLGMLSDFGVLGIVEIGGFEEFPGLSSSVSFVVNKIFADKMTTMPTINLITSRRSSRLKTNNFVSEFLMKTVGNSSKFALRLETASQVKVIRNRKRLNNVFILESFADFHDILEKLKPENFKLSGKTSHNLLVFISGEIREIPQMFELLWRLRINNVNAMFEDKNRDVLMKTIMPFTDFNCSDSSPVLLAKFRDKKIENSSISNFFPEKQENLHLCPIRVAIADDIDPFIFVKTKEKIVDLTGRDIKLIQTLSTALNATLNFTYIGKEGFFLENGSALGPLKVLQDNEADLSISDWWLKVNRMNFFSATSSYISDHLILIVPPGLEFSNFEKLIYPFAVLTWVLVFSSLLVGFAVILIVKKRSKKLQNFVFGVDVHHPCFNMFTVFIGDSQKILPKTNFARFLLTMLLIYSLVIRSLYQGSYFELMQSNQKHQEVQSFDEMVEKDFKLYAIDGVTDVTQAANVMASR
jgi:hypothetical protein